MLLFFYIILQTATIQNNIQTMLKSYLNYKFEVCQYVCVCVCVLITFITIYNIQYLSEFNSFLRTIKSVVNWNMF